MGFRPNESRNWVLNDSFNTSILKNAWFGLDGPYRVTFDEKVFPLSNTKMVVNIAHLLQAEWMLLRPIIQSYRLSEIMYIQEDVEYYVHQNDTEL